MLAYYIVYIQQKEESIITHYFHFCPHVMKLLSILHTIRDYVSGSYLFWSPVENINFFFAYLNHKPQPKLYYHIICIYKKNYKNDHAVRIIIYTYTLLTH